MATLPEATVRLQAAYSALEQTIIRLIRANCDQSDLCPDVCAWLYRISENPGCGATWAPMADLDKALTLEEISAWAIPDDAQLLGGEFADGPAAPGVLSEHRREWLAVCARTTMELGRRLALARQAVRRGANQEAINDLASLIVWGHCQAPDTWRGQLIREGLGS